MQFNGVYDYQLWQNLIWWQHYNRINNYNPYYSSLGFHFPQPIGSNSFETSLEMKSSTDKLDEFNLTTSSVNPTNQAKNFHQVLQSPQNERKDRNCRSEKLKTKKFKSVMKANSKILETTPGDILNDIAVVICEETDFNYRNENIEETEIVEVNEYSFDYLPELPFISELKFNYFGTYDENEGPFIPETDDENISIEIKKSKQKIRYLEKLRYNYRLKKSQMNNKKDVSNEIEAKNDLIDTNQTKDNQKQEEKVTSIRSSQRLRNKSNKTKFTLMSNYD